MDDTKRIPRADAATSELAEWWRAAAESEIDQTVAKALEYSGVGGGLPLDLVNLGQQMAQLQSPERVYTDAEYAEIGIYFYLVGKMGRWGSAIREGRPVSDDTLLDMRVYTRMVQRIREKGQWP